MLYFTHRPEAPMNWFFKNKIWFRSYLPDIIVRSIFYINWIKLNFATFQVAINIVLHYREVGDKNVEHDYDAPV